MSEYCKQICEPKNKIQNEIRNNIKTMPSYFPLNISIHTFNKNAISNINPSCKIALVFTTYKPVHG